MRKVLLSFCFFLSLVSCTAFAGGGIAHMFIAEETIAKLPNAKLRNLLLNNLDAYLVGSVYPDSGYIKGTSFGEDSHWDPFIYAFSDYLKAQYKDPVNENPKLVAFLFGCAAHRVSDEVTHWTFYHVMRDKDFHGDGNAAHTYGDAGIDFLLNIDKNRWVNYPATWWVPVKDLVAVYHRMGKDQYTADQIIWGNSVLAASGYGERVASPFAYPYLKWKMPWTAAHYYDWPEGGILNDEDKVATYQIKLWQRLTGTDAAGKPAAPSAVYNKRNSTSLQFATSALQKGAIFVGRRTNPDGSVEIQAPVVQKFVQFRILLSKFISKLTGL